MNKLSKPFRDPRVHVFFFCLFLVLLGWPLITVADQTAPPQTMLVYLFGLWLLMIGFLFVVGRSCKHHLASRGEEDLKLGGR